MEVSSSRRARTLAALAVIAASPLVFPAELVAQDAPDAIERPTIAIVIEPSCVEIDAAIVRRVLEVELGPDADLDAAPETASTRVRASCEAARVSLDLDEAITGKRLLRTIDVRATPPDGRSRLVALAIAELVSASWIELAMRHDPDVVVEGTRATEETSAIARDIARSRMPDGEAATPEEPPPPAAIHPRPLGIRAIGVGLLAGEPLHFSGGGGIALDWEVLAPLAILVDARAEHGSVGVGDLGSVGITSAWAGAMIALRLPLGLNHADFGIGGRLGAGWIEGTGARGVTGGAIAGPIAAVCGATHLSMHIAYSAYLHVGVELGWITLPVYGTLGSTGEVVARLGDGYLAITLGFEVRPE